MPHVLAKPDDYLDKAYKNDAGETHCVEFVRQTLSLPHTSMWIEGTKVTEGATIARGTAIATFVNGKYPQTGSTGKHAAIYLEQNKVGIVVLDQWKAQGSVKKRTIKFTPTKPGLSNDGKAFSIIEIGEAKPPQK